MIRKAPATTLRRDLGELLNEVQHRKARIVITKAGKPVAALIDIALFERLRKLDAEFEQLSGNMAKALAGVAIPKGTALVNRAIEAARRKRSRT